MRQEKTVAQKQQQKFVMKNIKYSKQNVQNDKFASFSILFNVCRDNDYL